MSLVAFTTIVTGLATCALLIDLWPSWRRLYPVCQDRKNYLMRWDVSIDPFIHEMAPDFFKAFKKRLPPNVIQEPMHLLRLQKRRRAEPNDMELVKITHAAVRDLIVQRYGEDIERAITMGLVRLPAPEFNETDAYPTCAAISMIALRSGKWATSGPPLVYEQ